LNRKAIAKRICPCIPLEHGDNELEISGEDILVDGLIKKGKGENQLEVAIGDGMEFTIHGDLKNKGKKNKLMNNTKVSVAFHSTQPHLAQPTIEY
jgi:voltage-gated sodium channel type II alpha